MSHYQTLDVPKTADPAAIKKAYRRAARKAHPDREGGSHQAMVAVARAYETLSDAEKRARYDETGNDGSGHVSLDDQAAMALNQLWDQVVSKIEEDADHIEVLRHAVTENQKDADQQIVKLTKKKASLERRAKKLKLKSKAGGVARFGCWSISSTSRSRASPRRSRCSVTRSPCARGSLRSCGTTSGKSRRHHRRLRAGRSRYGGLCDIDDRLDSPHYLERQ